MKEFLNRPLPPIGGVCSLAPKFKLFLVFFWYWRTAGPFFFNLKISHVVVSGIYRENSCGWSFVIRQAAVA